MSRFERWFGRYAELIPEFADFLESLNRPTPVHLRVNTLKTTPDAAVAALAAEGVEAVPEPWCPLVLKVVTDEPGALGTTLLHSLGHVYLQSASSALPALALGAEPGDRVLDLCAAPGSKTTFIAQAMGDKGSIVANEPARRRVKSLTANLERLGVTSALVTTYSGQNFPLRYRFRRVLVDAPCSGEGTWRGPRARPRRVKPDFRRYLSRQQGALLRRAYELLDPGGILVYSTCTYAPEENEAVVGPFVDESGARVLPLALDVGGDPALVAWEGQQFPRDLVHARRLYPHRFDSEGFFVIRMAKP